jgi:foldase protein PrsA
LANDEFVDLDDIVPGTGFSKKQDESLKKKEPVQEPKKVQLQTYDDEDEQMHEKEEKEEPKKPAKSEEKTEEKVKSSDKEAKPEKEEPKEVRKAKPQVKEQVKEPVKETSSKSELKSDKPFVKDKTEQSKTAASNFSKMLAQKKAQKLEHNQERKESKPELKQEQKPEKLAKQEQKETKIELKEKKQEKKEEKKEAKAEAKQEFKKTPLSKKDKKKAAKAAALKSRKDKPEKKSKEKNKGKDTNWTLIALLILGVIIIGVIVYMALNFDFTKSNQESVVAVVNGQPIYKSELMNRYNLLKSTMNPYITEEQVLNLTITDRLLLQEAAKRGITTTDEEVKALISQIMVQNNIDEASLKSDLADKNVSYDFLVNMYKNTLTINKLVNQSFGNMTFTDAELKDFYNLSKEELKVPDMVQVRHILFLYGNNSDADTYNKSIKVLNMINTNKSNFCSLVTQYSEDLGSKDTCGEYNYSKDYPFVKEFIDAGFAMKKGEVKIIKTQLGYHIMYKVADLPAYIPSFEQVKEQLKPVLIQEKSIEGLNALIDELQSNAVIEIYSENISTKRFKEITAAKNEAPAVETLPETTQTANNSTVTETEKTVPNLTADTGYATAQVNVVTKEVVSTPKSQKMLLAECLTDKKARMFTASWSPDSTNQLALFGEDNSTLTIIECDPEAQNANVAECSSVLKKQYPTWPTWQINSTLYEGIQSLSALAKESGCTY